MAIIIATIALALCWAWIEITLYFTNKNSKDENAVKSISNLRSLIEKFLIDLKEENCLRNITFRNTIQNTI